MKGEAKAATRVFRIERAALLASNKAGVREDPSGLNATQVLPEPQFALYLH